MSLDMAQIIRLKGTADAVLNRSSEKSAPAAVALTHTYLAIRSRCLQAVTGTDAENEFKQLFPLVDPVQEEEARFGSDAFRLAAKAERARLLLAQLAGWLGAWPSAEALLAELITAVESAEAQAEEPAQKARLKALVEGLKGAGRDVAISVVAAYLARVPI
jgi:hypothetical protein